jgi:hypothetical protein
MSYGTSRDSAAARPREMCLVYTEDPFKVYVVPSLAFRS